MAFRAGNRARKKESVQDTVKIIDPPSIDEVIEEFHHVVGEYTHDIRQSIRDRVNAAVLLYRVESYKEKLREEFDDDKASETTKDKNNNSYWNTLVDMIAKLINNEALESTKDKNNNSYRDTPYWNTLVNMIKNMENINESILPLLKHEPNYCFNPIIRKIFAGDITDFVAYPYPVNCGLELEDDEKKLLIDINNFKCSFMEETMGNLYLSTKIILSNLKPAAIVDKRFVVYVIQDKLGFYTKSKFDIVEPEVWLLLKEIGTEAESMGCDRKFVLAKVYIHEMMHRYYDMHPELLLKKSVKEIEEPMAEFATIKFCEEFCKDHVEHNELLNVAINQTNRLRGTKHYIYALGADLYDFKYSTSLINKYRHTCMMMHKDNNPVKKYETIVNGQKGNYNKKERNEEAAETLCDELEKCIDEYEYNR